MKILVVGASGQLGQAMVRRLSAQHAVTALTRRDADMSDHAALHALATPSNTKSVL